MNILLDIIFALFVLELLVKLGGGGCKQLRDIIRDGEYLENWEGEVQIKLNFIQMQLYVK
jgi:hypothetical protein